MRSQVPVAVVCVVIGGAITVGALRMSGALSGTRTIVQQGSLLAANMVGGGTAAGDVYRSGASGVVALRAHTVAAPPTAFDDGTTAGVVTGAATLVDDQGHLLTAAHLVRAATDVEIDAGGRRAWARVVGMDPSTDLAVLHVDDSQLGLAPIALGNSDAVQVGDPVVALGREAGAAPALATGTVAARQASVPAAGGGRLVDVLQVDANLDQSDVGGPLLDGSGEVVGLDTLMRTPDASAPVDLAVPADTARRVLSRMLQSSQKVVSG